MPLLEEPRLDRLIRCTQSTESTKCRLLRLTRYKYPFAIELAEQTGLTGPGVFHPMLRKQLGEDAEIVSIDLSLNMLQQCRKQHASDRIELIQANAQNLPFADESFDALFHFGGVKSRAFHGLASTGE